MTRTVIALLALALVGCGAEGEAQPPVRVMEGAPAAAGDAFLRNPAVTPVPAAEGAPRLDVDAPQPDLEAAAAILVDERSGEVLFALNADAQRAPASLTKIATAALALSSGRLDETVEVDVDYARDLESDSRVVGLVPGDRFTLRELVYALMLPSGNDAALAISRTLAGSDEAFVQDMNALTADLGLSGTRFIDPHGLGGPGHYSTARDLAALTRFAFTLPEFDQIVATRLTTITGTQHLELWNANEFLYYYAGADGVKVGYTEEAGDTIVASATREGHRLIAVVLDTPLPVAAARSLLDWAWEHACWPAPRDAALCKRVSLGP